jgi:hypothetical protein
MIRHRDRQDASRKSARPWPAFEKRSTMATLQPPASAAKPPVPPPSQAPPASETNRFGITTATALVVGSIIGVGSFNLPTSLASYGPPAVKGAA